MNYDDTGEVPTNPIEAFIKKVYTEGIKNKPTFDEKMQEQIKRELQRLVDEANEIRENGEMANE